MLACERDIPKSKACPFETVDMDIEHGEAFISKATPKAVILTVIGSHHDTYVSLIPDLKRVCIKVVSKSGEQLLTFHTKNLVSTADFLTPHSDSGVY